LLLALALPDNREVAVEVEPLERSRELHGEAVVVADPALREDPVVLASIFVGLPPDHQPRVLRGDLPLAARVLETHLEQAAVAVDVVAEQAVGLVEVGVGPDPAADEAGRLLQA